MSLVSHQHKQGWVHTCEALRLEHSDRVQKLHTHMEASLVVGALSCGQYNRKQCDGHTKIELKTARSLLETKSQRIRAHMQTKQCFQTLLWYDSSSAYVNVSVYVLILYTAVKISDTCDSFFHGCKQNLLIEN